MQSLELNKNKIVHKFAFKIDKLMKTNIKPRLKANLIREKVLIYFLIYSNFFLKIVTVNIIIILYLFLHSSHRFVLQPIK